LPVPVTKLSAGEVTHRWPEVLPGSQTVLFTADTQASGSFDDANVEIVSIQTGERTTLQRGGSSPRYFATVSGSTADGHLVYLRGSTLFAAPVDAGRLALRAAPAAILEDVSSTLVAGGEFAFSRIGTFVYLAGKAALTTEPISWVDHNGKMTQPLHPVPGRYRTLRFSPDGKRLAFALASGKAQDIWVKDLDRDITSRLTFLPGGNEFSLWTPDGKTIVFRSSNPAAPGLYAIRADGSGEATRLTEGGAYPSSFSPDGQRLAIVRPGNGGNLDIFMLPVVADAGPGGTGLRLGKAELFLGTPFSERRPVFSPDGRWLAYNSNESGADEVYVRPFSLPGGGPGGRWQVSTGGGHTPLWSRDGRDLLFLSLEGRVMAARYTVKGDTFSAEKPRVWTETRLRSSLGIPSYDLAPDGKRLAAIVANEDDGKLPANLTFLLNFGDELRRKAPVQ
jgi:serine/threonine-protein kinase